MNRMDWKEVIDQWRRLPADEQRRMSLSRIPGKVARSMAFEGEPVSLLWLQAQHVRLLTPHVPSTSPKAG